MDSGLHPISEGHAGHHREASAIELSHLKRHGYLSVPENVDKERLHAKLKDLLHDDPPNFATLFSQPAGVFLISRFAAEKEHRAVTKIIR